MIFYIIVHAPAYYWKLLAERAQNKLEKQLQENRQVYYRK
jgi:hypothetical protein